MTPLRPLVVTLFAVLAGMPALADVPPSIPDVMQAAGIPYKPTWAEGQFEGLERLEELVFEYTNNEREKAGLPRLAQELKLRTAARQHSIEMLNKGYFAHESPVALHYKPMDRVRLAGYFGLAGENILTMHGRDISNEPMSAAHIVNLWMKSPGHRANILRTTYNEMGVGIARKGTHVMATQVFGAGTFAFGDIRLTKLPNGKLELTGKASLKPGMTYTRAVVAVNKQMGQSFEVQPGREFVFKAVLPASGVHTVGLYPEENGSYWVMELMKVDADKPLTEAMSPAP